MKSHILDRLTSIKNKALTCDHPFNTNDNDYTLNSDSCWITANDISIFIKKQQIGILIECYPLYQEHEDAITSVFCPYDLNYLMEKPCSQLKLKSMAK